MTRVRDAVPDDAPAIARVHGETWQAAYAHVFPAERLAALSERLEARTSFWRETIEAQQPRSHTLVAGAGELVGFASVGPARDADSDDGELYAIYVLPAHWGSGAGRALHDEAVERLRRDGFPRAALWVLEDNPRARSFYERAGWRPDGAEREDTLLETRVREVRYVLALPAG